MQVWQPCARCCIRGDVAQSHHDRDPNADRRNMIGRGASRLLVTVALLCATVAWTGWVVLHTVADPSRSSRIAHAVFDNPEARGQLADDLASSLAGAANSAATTASAGTGVKVPKIDGADPTLRAAVASALADPRVTTDVVDALAAEHANLLGVEPKKPASINTALLVEAVNHSLGVANPALAAQLTSAAPKSVELPDVEIPFAATAHRFATTWVPRLALLAVLLAGVALVAGDRLRVLRRIGVWAVGAGLMWVIIPRGLIWLAEQWAPGNAAVVRAVLHGATGVVTAMATLLVIGGVAAVVASIVIGRVGFPSGWGERDVRDRTGVPSSATSGDSSSGWRTFTGRDMPPSSPRPAPRRFDQRA
jgi:hypothetical protein